MLDIKLLFILAGCEIREQLNEHVAQLYADLDGGLTHLAWLLPGWLPLPSFRLVTSRPILVQLLVLDSHWFCNVTKLIGVLSNFLFKEPSYSP